MTPRIAIRLSRVGLPVFWVDLLQIVARLEIDWLAEHKSVDLVATFRNGLVHRVKPCQVPLLNFSLAGSPSLRFSTKCGATTHRLSQGLRRVEDLDKLHFSASQFATVIRHTRYDDSRKMIKVQVCTLKSPDLSFNQPRSRRISLGRSGCIYSSQ